MIRRLPAFATVLVLAAVALMIGLGFWQLRRAEEKQALLARFEAARNLPPIAFPSGPPVADPPLFRRATGLCLKPVGRTARAGRNRAGTSGYAIVIACSTGAEGPGMAVEIGWTSNPNAAVRWNGGPVSGTIAPDRDARLRLVSDQGLAGLEPSAPPSVADIPNNHRSYAVQWFLFAAIALLIYGLALRQKLLKDKPQ